MLPQPAPAQAVDGARTPVPQIGADSWDIGPDEGGLRSRRRVLPPGGIAPANVPALGFRYVRLNLVPRPGPLPLRTILPLQNLHFEVLGGTGDVSANYGRKAHQYTFDALGG